MTYSIIISPSAETDIREIQEYYDSLVLGLGEKFIIKFDETLRMLQTHPKIYAITDVETRSAYMDNFPYAVFFSVFEDKYEADEIIQSIRQERHFRERDVEL